MRRVVGEEAWLCIHAVQIRQGRKVGERNAKGGEGGRGVSVEEREKEERGGGIRRLFSLYKERLRGR